MAAEMTPEAAAKLREPFPPAAIGKLPKGGVLLDYVGHAATTDRLLQVDPEWSWEPMALDAQGLPLIVGGQLWIRLTVCGVTRIGVGDGKSDKERIGDAIRNAAMRFGVALDLWAKEDLRPPARTVGPSKVELVGLCGGDKVRAAELWKASPLAGLAPDAEVSDEAWAALVAAAAEPVPEAGS